MQLGLTPSDFGSICRKDQLVLLQTSRMCVQWERNWVVSTETFLMEMESD